MHHRILVADDDSDCLDIICKVLELGGADVMRVTNGGDLLERLEQGEYELVITDVSMPSMTGIEAMRSARRLGCKTPAIVMTARQDALAAEDISALGDDVLFLPKPFHLDDLDAAVAKLLD